MKDKNRLGSDPLVSVIMTAYNTGPYIKKSIENILSQTYSNIELLIADDASVDNTREIIRSFSDPRIKVFHNPFRMHYLNTCNKLFSLCTGELITFQDSDDWSDPDRIRIQVKAFLDDPRIGANSVNFVKVDETGEKELFRSSYPYSGKEVMKKIPDSFPILAGAIMVRRDVLEYVGYYNTFFNKVGSEHLYWFYLILEKFMFINLPDHLYYYRYNPTSFTNRDTLRHCNHLIALESLRYLVYQRRETGTDCIENNNLEEVGKMFGKILKSQKFKILHSDRLSWNGYHKEAFMVLVKATIKNPLVIGSTFKRMVFNFRKMRKQTVVL